MAILGIEEISAQCFGRGFPGEGLSWPAVESGGHGIENIGGMEAEIGALGKVLVE
jgi:hypothetical protein